MAVGFQLVIDCADPDVLAASGLPRWDLRLRHPDRLRQLG
jgi:hypothetical protein